MNLLHRDNEVTCQNCGTPGGGTFCHVCGQSRLDLSVSLWRMLARWLGDVLDFDGRMLRSLRLMLLRPGQLSREFMQGRRASQMTPVKLLLLSMLVPVLAQSVQDKILAPSRGHASEVKLDSLPDDMKRVEFETDAGSGLVAVGEVDVFVHYEAAEAPREGRTPGATAWLVPAIPECEVWGFVCGIDYSADVIRHENNKRFVLFAGGNVSESETGLLAVVRSLVLLIPAFVVGLRLLTPSRSWLETVVLASHMVAGLLWLWVPWLLVDAVYPLGKRALIIYLCLAPCVYTTALVRRHFALRGWALVWRGALLSMLWASMVVLAAAAYVFIMVVTQVAGG